jgi:hypothetical protein
MVRLQTMARLLGSLLSVFILYRCLWVRPICTRDEYSTTMVLASVTTVWIVTAWQPSLSLGRVVMKCTGGTVAGIYRVIDRYSRNNPWRYPYPSFSSLMSMGSSLLYPCYSRSLACCSRHRFVVLVIVLFLLILWLLLLKWYTRRWDELCLSPARAR